ncbi:hypothetical protein AVEN_209105-1 [Araneus ventricosus]|uniref:Uncharacterized protein n=1 Tax=Araneus ventricosus TaxID=182803 RepID=A0A4Y2MUX3_ARAVE|nr:hypothetical protein AVEN_209105-1 [Araneus ventricosus]
MLDWLFTLPSTQWRGGIHSSIFKPSIRQVILTAFRRNRIHLTGVPISSAPTSPALSKHLQNPRQFQFFPGQKADSSFPTYLHRCISSDPCSTMDFITVFQTRFRRI